MKDYKEKYEKALERARNIRFGNPQSATANTVCEEIFPELKESEDEKIRKAILALVKQSSHILNPMNQKSMIAWLEKQGEQKSTDKVEPRFKVGDCIRHKGADECYRIVAINDNYYFCENNHAWNISSQDYFELVEQKTAWSEEDGAYITLISEILNCEHRHGKFTTNGIKFFNNDIIAVEQIQDWLKSIKERMKGE